MKIIINLIILMLVFSASGFSHAQEIRRIDLARFTQLSPNPSNPHDGEESRSSEISRAYHTTYGPITRIQDGQKIIASGKPILLLVSYANGATQVYEVWNPTFSIVGRFVDNSLRFKPVTGGIADVPATYIYITPIYEYIEMGRWIYVSVTTDGVTRDGWRWMLDGFNISCVSNCDGTPNLLIN
jgi:hypothetical protein